MATKNEPVAQETEKKIEEALTKSGKFFEDNSKTILSGFIGVCIIVALVFAYIYMYKAPREQEAADKMYKAMEMYAMDSMELALNGNSEFMGLLDVAEEYSGTPQANMANHTIGICYLNLGKYEEAIKYFEAFKAVKGGFGRMITAQNIGLIGDAYMQLGDTEKGLKYYEDAVKADDNAVSSATYLFKAASINCSNGNCKKAYDQFCKIRDSYPNSPYTRTIDKYIALAEQGINE